LVNLNLVILLLAALGAGSEVAMPNARFEPDGQPLVKIYFAPEGQRTPENPCKEIFNACPSD